MIDCRRGRADASMELVRCPLRRILQARVVDPISAPLVNPCSIAACSGPEVVISRCISSG